MTTIGPGFPDKPAPVNSAANPKSTPIIEGLKIISPLNSEGTPVKNVKLEKSGSNVDIVSQKVFSSVPSTEKEIGVNPKDAEGMIEAFGKLCEKEFEKEKTKDPRFVKLTVREWLEDPGRLENGEKPRIELRAVPGTKPTIIGNIALCFGSGEARAANFDKLKEQFPQLSIVAGGQTTLEIGNAGVHKGLIIHYADNHFSELLNQMNYIPGPGIDARKNKSAIYSDFDGTLTKKPEKGMPPESSNLANSDARAGVLNYLRAGGVLVIISGNDPQRVANRLLLGIPRDEMEVLLTRIAISAAGGHTLLTFDKAGNLKEVEGYRKNALSELEMGQKELNGDYVYIGDDKSAKGNDFEAFVKVGEGKFICVSKEEIKGDEHHLGAAMKETHVKGEDVAVGHIFNGAVNLATIIPGQKIFSRIADAASSARSQPAAETLVTNALKALGGREGIDRAIAENESLNGPGYVKKETIDEAINSYKQVKGNKNEDAMNYNQILALSEEYRQILSNHGLSDLTLRNNLSIDKNPETALKLSLEGFKLKANDVVRILVPGNNDQSNAMYVGMQIKWILEFAKSKGFDLNVEVLVMGKGGHATTAAFPQFMQISKLADNKMVFSGTREADALTETLEQTLNEVTPPIPFKETIKFGNHTGVVQIMRARDSTNTGENALEAAKATTKSEERTNIKLVTLVTSATSQATRQLLTFSQQLSIDKNKPEAEKLYDDLLAIPLQKSERYFRETANDFQAVTEMYSGLAEQCRFYLYAYKPNPFIPAQCVIETELELLYKTYAKLSGKEFEAAKADSLKTMLAFFQDRFATLENAILWNKDEALQQLATGQTVKKTARRSKMISKIFPNLRDAWNRHKLLSSPDIVALMDPKQREQAANLVANFNKLKAQVEDPATDDQKKQVIYATMALIFGPRMKKLMNNIINSNKT